MNIERLNINVNGTPSLGFNGGDTVFHEIASLVGKALPKSYIDFMRRVDGGHPEIGCFYPEGSDPANIFEVDWFYSLATPGIERVKDTIANWGTVLGVRTLPIGRDGGGNQIYIDLDASSIWLYLHDESGKRLKISDSLEEFLDGLVGNPNFI